MKAQLLISGILFTVATYSQVGIGTNTPSIASMLEVGSTMDGGITYAGFMPPRVPNIAGRNSMVVGPMDAGLIIFLKSSGCLQLWTGTVWENIKCSSQTPNPPTLLGIQNFEIVPGTPNLPVEGIEEANYRTGNGAFPNLPLYVSPSRGYGVVNDGATLTFGPVDVSSYTFVIVRFHLASFATVNTQGADAPDSVILSMSLDGGVTYVEELTVLGFGNSKWGFDNETTVSATYNGTGIPTIFQSTGTYDSGIGNVELKNFPAGSEVYFRITLLNDRVEEMWVIDDVEIFGL